MLDTLDETAAWPIDGYLIASPYYIRPSQRGLVQHFTALADHASWPIVLYNIPYRTAVNLDSAFAGEGEHTVSIGELASGLAKVRINGKDCATVWCAPWTAAVPAGTLRPGANEIEIEYINNWVNRLIGDCFLNPEERVTASCLKYVKGPRSANGKTLNSYSGYCTEDELQRSGLLGPVTIERRTAQNAD
jgi:hypothetical protein